MRLNRYLALATGLSRRAADNAIKTGEVTVDNSPGELGQEVSKDQIIRYQGHVINPKPYQYLLLNKPTGYITSRIRQGTAATVYDLIPSAYNHLKPVGRLDRDSHGLMLFTNDGELAQRLTHPVTGHPKHYRLTLDRPFARADQRRLAGGIELEDGLSKPRLLRCQGRTLELELSEGRNRQLRRTMAALGYEVQDLERTAIGNLVVTAVASGHWRLIKNKDIS